jgi:hypothetical protein
VFISAAVTVAPLGSDGPGSVPFAVETRLFTVAKALVSPPQSCWSSPRSPARP